MGLKIKIKKIEITFAKEQQSEPQLDFSAKKPHMIPRVFVFLLFGPCFFWKLIFWYQILFFFCFSHCMLSDKKNIIKNLEERENT